MKKSFNIFLLLITLAMPGILLGQSTQLLLKAEENLNRIFNELYGITDDGERKGHAIKFSGDFYEALLIDGSYNHPFDSLAKVSALTSPDGSFRIYTWNIPLTAGNNMFFGFLQLRDKGSDSTIIIELHDRSSETVDPESAAFSPDRWFGAIYYKIIPEKTHSGETIYTLLGWHGVDFLMSSRIIEVLTIHPGGKVLFGKPLFCGYGDDRPYRIVFRYSARSTMNLRYEKQSIVTSKNWNARKREFEYTREKAYLIVCDRLVPADPQLEGQYEYYIPSGEVMDGFRFQDGCWQFMEDVDARNTKSD